MRTDSKKIKFIAVIACVVLVVATSIGATVAYVIDQQTVTLTYDMAKFDMIFADDSVFYTSNVPVYFRFMISYNGDVDDITVTGSDWSLVGNYYYYNGILPADSDGNAFDLPEISVSTDTSVQYDIIAEICQIEPSEAAMQSWGVTYGANGWEAVSSINP